MLGTVFVDAQARPRPFPLPLLLPRTHPESRQHSHTLIPLQCNHQPPLAVQTLTLQLALTTTQKRLTVAQRARQLRSNP